MLRNLLKKSIGLVIILGLGLLLGACSGESRPSRDEGLADNSLLDDYGQEFQIDRPRKRIVSLSPSTTEILFALGLEDEIVGVSSYSDYPKEALDKELVGDFGQPNLEKIIGLGPDIVINSGDDKPESRQILEDAGIEMASFNSSSIEQVMEEIEKIGSLTQRQDQAREVVENMELRLEQVKEKTQDLGERKKVFYEIWHDPLTSAGKNSFMDQLISLAGGENVAAQLDSPYPEVSLEWLIDSNPDVYLATNDGTGKSLEEIKSRPGYKNIRAIEEDQVYLLEANILSRPGPRIVEALEILYETINQEGAK